MGILDEETQARLDELSASEQSGTIDDNGRMELQKIRDRMSEE